jgi:anthranilate phosphoribosyltransferase
MNSSESAVVQAIRHLQARRDLSGDLTFAVFSALMRGEIGDVQLGALLFGLAQKGESAEEIAGAAKAMRENALRISAKRRPLIDTCGTGGSGLARRNVSTAVAICVAACGVGVAKHGNRGATSPSGSADVLEALGVRIDASPETVNRCIDEVGVGFLFARTLHPAMRFAAPARQALGIRTIFNLLGPLTNPAGVRRQVMGVYDPERCVPMAIALADLGAERALVLHGFRSDGSRGVDDVSCEGETLVAQAFAGEISTMRLTPAEAGVDRYPLHALSGGTPAENAEALAELLLGKKGAYRDAVVYAGAIALLVAGDEPVASLPHLANQIRAVLDDGRAHQTLQNLIAVSTAT